jgi:hypothetical protein
LTCGGDGIRFLVAIVAAGFPEERYLVADLQEVLPVALLVDRGSPRSFGPPSTKAKYAAIIAADMSRKFKLLLALVLVVLAYRMFVGGDTEVVEYETSD